MKQFNRARTIPTEILEDLTERADDITLDDPEN